jgi:hypothetical protein
MIKINLVKTSLITVLVFIIAACTQAENTLSQAKRDLPFPVLFPEEMLEQWDVEETVYEDRLLVTTFHNEEEGRVELIQDQNIQGLDLEELRNYVLSNRSFTDQILEGNKVVEVEDFVGELAIFMEPTPTVQYTFVQKKDLFSEVNGNVPYYQVIGTDISQEELKRFISTLEAST